MNFGNFQETFCHIKSIKVSNKFLYDIYEAECCKYCLWYNCIYTNNNKMSYENSEKFPKSFYVLYVTMNDVNNDYYINSFYTKYINR